MGRGMGDLKTCSQCKETKLLTLFSRNKNSKDGRKSICKSCQSDYNKKWTSLNKEKKYERSKWWQKETKYGITKEKYQQLLLDQDNKCAICGTVSEENNHGHLYVDHDHLTKKVRGLLCRACNSALGLFRDNIEILEKAKQYLKDQT